MGIPDHLTCLLRNVHADQEATARTRHGTMDWFKFGKYGKVVYCHLAYLNHILEYIMQTAGLDKLQARIKIPTCLLRNLYAGQEATVRTGHGTIDWFQIGKGVRQGCILSPCYLTYMQSTS